MGKVDIAYIAVKHAIQLLVSLEFKFAIGLQPLNLDWNLHNLPEYCTRVCETQLYVTSGL